jgi:hypothetical protein
MTALDVEAVELKKPLWKVKRVYRGPGVAFIPHPHVHGAWVRVHPCVVESACPDCNAGVGELCTSTRGHTVAHHYKRARP